MNESSIEIFLTSITRLWGDGFVAFNNGTLKKYCSLSQPTLKKYMDIYIEKNWLIEIHKEQREKCYAITHKCPMINQMDAFNAIGLLQVYNKYYYDNNRLCYGYGTALNYLELSETIMKPIRYAWRRDPGVKPPQNIVETIFKKSQKIPAYGCKWGGLELYVSRRHPDNLQDRHLTKVQIENHEIQCTGPIRTLIDCWLRPDLADGEDRVAKSWGKYINQNNMKLVSNEIGDVLMNGTDRRIGMIQELNSWLDSLFPGMSKLNKEWITT